MSYAVIEAAVQTLLQALGQYGDADVTRGDWRVLDSGSGPYAVVYAGPFDVEEGGDWGQKVYAWTVYVEVFERYLDNGTSETNLETRVQNTVDQLCAYPTLDGASGVTLAMPVHADELRYVFDEQGGGPHFIMQRIAERVWERVQYAGSGEFA